MDPITDIIPDDHEEEVRKRLRDRDGDVGSERPQKRPRADTHTLLPPAGKDKEEVGDMFEPEADLHKYSRERLQQGLQRIDTQQKRKITPRTVEFLKQHKDAYKIALDDPTPRESALLVVQALDRIYHSASFYFAERSTDESKHTSMLLKLRRLELLGNYGDYLGQTLQEFRAKFKEAAVAPGTGPEFQTATKRFGNPKLWTDIADELAGEDLQGLNKDLWVVCDVLGIDTYHMLWVIQTYADRNNWFHNYSREFISKGYWGKLAAQICRDQSELIKLDLPEDERERYQTTIAIIRDEYFEVLNRNEPERWLANAKAQEVSRKLWRKK